MSREAIEEAIEVLEDASAEMLMETGDKNYYIEAIAVLRQALVDADDTSQERVDGPVAWSCQCGRPYTVTCISSKPQKKEWVGLTDEEVMVAAYQAGFDIHEDYDNEDDPEKLYWWSADGEASNDSLLKLRDFIEAKLKEKNT